MKLLYTILFAFFISCSTTKSESEDCAVIDCAGACDENVELWGECYNIEEITNLSPPNSQTSGQLIPSSIGNLTNLTGLWLDGNQLIGEIPAEIGNLTNLTHLSLGDNHHTGEIPSEIGNLTNLTHLYLHFNQLSGGIPPIFGDLTSLTSLHLNNNQLTGEIPTEVCELIESNNLSMGSILNGNNLINTCE